MKYVVAIAIVVLSLVSSALAGKGGVVYGNSTYSEFYEYEETPLDGWTSAVGDATLSISGYSGAGTLDRVQFYAESRLTKNSGSQYNFEYYPSDNPRTYYVLHTTSVHPSFNSMQYGTGSHINNGPPINVAVNGAFSTRVSQGYVGTFSPGSTSSYPAGSVTFHASVDFGDPKSGGPPAYDIFVGGRLDGRWTARYDFSTSGTPTPDRFDISNTASYEPDFAIDYDEIYNAGELLLSGADWVSERSTGTLFDNSGVLAFDYDQTFFDSTPNSASKLANSGIVAKVSGTGTTTIPMRVEHSAGTWNVGSGTLANSGTFSIISAGTLNKVGSGTLVISGAQSHSSGAKLIARAGVTNLQTNAGSSGTANLSVESRNSGTRVNANALQNIATVTLDGGDLHLAAGGGAALFATSVAVTNGSKLDVHDNGIAIDYISSSPLSSVRTSIISAYNSGSWTGSGITSTEIVNALDHAVGYGEASVSGRSTFFGQSVDSSTLLVKYTYAGDVNLDGIVNVSDQSLMFANWNGTGNWTDGDVNYDGNINASDFSLLARNWQKTQIVGRAAIPEPSLILLPAGFVICFGRKRRR